MKIRRFLAPTMREALAEVREELGPDAVILSSGRTDSGIEVVCAADYDPTLMAGALLQAGGARVRREQASPPAQPAESSVPRGFQAILARVAGSRADAPPADLTDEGADADAPAGETVSRHQEIERPTGSPRIVWSQDAEIVAMRREVEALRKLLEYQLAKLAWDDLARREPFRARVLRDLSSLDIAPDIARQMANSMPAVTNQEDASRVALALLLKHLPVAESGLPAAGGTFALVGPTGAGKTTTLAKLAAQYARRHGPAAVGLVSLDGYRLGARDQLAALARILGVPMKVAATPAELATARRQLTGRRLVLVDTAGVGQQGLRLREQTSLILSQRGAVTPLLVLPANADLATLDDIIRAQRALAPAACIVTKIDETASLGAVLSAVIRSSLPIAQLCDGQRIPEDLHTAGPRRVWLLRTAVKLRSRSGRVADQEYLAEHFGGVVAHA